MTIFPTLTDPPTHAAFHEILTNFTGAPPKFARLNYPNAAPDDELVRILVAVWVCLWGCTYCLCLLDSGRLLREVPAPSHPQVVLVNHLMIPDRRFVWLEEETVDGRQGRIAPLSAPPAIGDGNPHGSYYWNQVREVDGCGGAGM